MVGEGEERENNLMGEVKVPGAKQDRQQQWIIKKNSEHLPGNTQVKMGKMGGGR